MAKERKIRGLGTVDCMDKNRVVEFEWFFNISKLSLKWQKIISESEAVKAEKERVCALWRGENKEERSKISYDFCVNLKIGCDGDIYDSRKNLTCKVAVFIEDDSQDSEIGVIYIPVEDMGEQFISDLKKLITETIINGIDEATAA